MVQESTQLIKCISDFFIYYAVSQQEKPNYPSHKLEKLVTEISRERDDAT